MKVSFMASLPPTTTAVKIDGQDGNARLQLEIPASELAEVIKIPAFFRKKPLRVTIEIIDESYHLTE